MRRQSIVPGAVLYYAEGVGGSWRSAAPRRATVVDAAPLRIRQVRCGAAYAVSWHPDPNGTGVLVDLDNGVRTRRTAVYMRHLRGPWGHTMAALGRSTADWRAAAARLADVAARPGPVGVDALLGLVAKDQAVSDDMFSALLGAVEEEGIERMSETYRIRVRTHRADGKVSEHISGPMSLATATAWVEESNKTGGGVSSSSMITEEECDAILARFVDGEPS